MSAMSRLARVVAVDCPHHVTQRGNYRQQTFFCDDDYRLYLELLTDYSRQYSLELWGYCLMPNHVHVIAVPRESNSLARAFGRTHSDYARGQHIRSRRMGHLWQARFYSCPLDETSQWPALAYVERNALRAGLVETADAWRWSSAAVHCGSGNNSVTLELAAWRKWYDAERWRQVLATSVVEEAIGERIREATARGLPLGGEALRRRLEHETGRCLEMRPPGRPPRKKERACERGPLEIGNS
jgi:putative transposase